MPPIVAQFLNDDASDVNCTENVHKNIDDPTYSFDDPQNL